MIDKILELSRAVVTEARYGESNRRVGVDQDAGVTVMPCGKEPSATDHRSRRLGECLPGVGLSAATAIRLALAMKCPERVERRIRSAACRLPMTIMAVAIPAVALR